MQENGPPFQDGRQCAPLKVVELWKHKTIVRGQTPVPPAKPQQQQQVSGVNIAKSFPEVPTRFKNVYGRGSRKRPWLHPPSARCPKLTGHPCSPLHPAESDGSISARAPRFQSSTLGPKSVPFWRKCSIRPGCQGEKRYVGDVRN